MKSIVKVIVSILLVVLIAISFSISSFAVQWNAVVAGSFGLYNNDSSAPIQLGTYSYSLLQAVSPTYSFHLLAEVNPAPQLISQLSIYILDENYSNPAEALVVYYNEVSNPGYSVNCNQFFYLDDYHTYTYRAIYKISGMYMSMPVSGILDYSGRFYFEHGSITWIS